MTIPNLCTENAYETDDVQALLQAGLDPQYQSIRDATLGLVFLGTPHRGTDKATYGKVLANVAQFISHQPSSHLLTALQTNSDVLLRLTIDFRFQLPNYHVFSFYEQRPMHGLSSLVQARHIRLLVHGLTPFRSWKSIPPYSRPTTKNRFPSTPITI